LLSQNNLCSYYYIEKTPGITQRNPALSSAYAYLDDEKVANQLLNYKDDNMLLREFSSVPAHALQLLYLVVRASLYKLNPNISRCQSAVHEKRTTFKLQPSKNKFSR
jgi:Cu+-exporting ATPase